MQLEQDLFSGHSVTSARDLREIFRKIFVGEREHSRFLTSFAEAIHFADSENFYALAPSALLLIDHYPILATYAHQVLDVDDPETTIEEDNFSGLRIEPHLATPAAKVCVWYKSGKWCATIFANTSQGKMTIAHENGVHVSVIKRGEGPLEPR
jgi:hypothetical protein